ncbi:PQQ-dependent sugar dehydrogenase [uncultured Psychrobacter sp.]|uniref:PQQ-dependent sugar dehydrogenase n=1 Tax=uncultured Psychrobacter sp. TaxID=259303 RepID=UPI003459FEFB
MIIMKTTSKYISAPLAIAALLFGVSACSNPTMTRASDTPLKSTNNSASSSSQIQASTEKPTFTTETVATFDEPWAMTALPKSDNEALKLLVTQKTGELFVVNTETGTKTQVSGVPKVAYGGQGGLGDVVLAPDFTTTNAVYISYVEEGMGADNNKFGAKVIKATLAGLDTDQPNLQAVTPIWQQNQKVSGQGHYSHRLLFSPDGRHLYISSGDRQQKDPAQDMSVNLGKIIRLNPDGSIPDDNPFADENSTSDIASQFWTIGHRNVLGMVFDDTGKLWAHEMGPKGGDEFNLIEQGNNYGWPIVSNGRNYSGTDIPDHDTRPDFTAPKVSWTPVISPSSMSIYERGSHNDFPAWQGDALISGLSSKALIVVDIDDNNEAAERYRYDMGARIRSVLVQNGSVWLLEDETNAKLLKLLPE